METLGPAPELDAVNEMLAAIFKAPLSNINSLPPDGATALNILRSVSRDLQEEGWSFNTEEAVTLLPDADADEIDLAEDVLRVDGTDVDVVERNRKLFDREDNTFTFTEGVEVDLVRHLPWDELPSIVRRYVTALAMERFVAGRGGQLTAAQDRNLVRAQMAFSNAEDENGDLNILSQSLSVSSMLRRGF